MLELSVDILLNPKMTHAVQNDLFYEYEYELIQGLGDIIWNSKSMTGTGAH